MKINTSIFGKHMMLNYGKKCDMKPKFSVFNRKWLLLEVMRIPGQLQWHKPMHSALVSAIF